MILALVREKTTRVFDYVMETEKKNKKTKSSGFLYTSTQTFITSVLWSHVWAFFRHQVILRFSGHKLMVLTV